MLSFLKAPDRKSIQRVTSWVNKHKPNDDAVLTKQSETQVMVTEIECKDDGCVPIETLVILIGSVKRWSGKILKDVASVVEDDVVELMKEIGGWSTKKIENPAAIITSSDSLKNDTESEKIEFSLYLSDLLHNVPKFSNEKRARLSTYLVSVAHEILSQDENTVEQNDDANSKLIRNLIEISSNADLGDEVTSKLVEPKIDAFSTTKKGSFVKPIVVKAEESGPKIRHSKGVRPRGCPCCDPDNMENIVDRLLFLNAPP